MPKKDYAMFFPRIRRPVMMALVLVTCAIPVVADTITVSPASPVLSGSFPFGIGQNWTPFAGFIYKNVPAFDANTGDTLAFDLGRTNDVNIQLSIAMARTTVNGGTQPAEPFVSVAFQQTPANPAGNTIVGDFELRFSMQAQFSFPGGGLIIRFNPGPAFIDNTGTQVLVSTQASDSSDFFVGRFFADADGVFPFQNPDTNAIAGFQLVTAIVPEPASSTMAAFAIFCASSSGRLRRR